MRTIVAALAAVVFVFPVSAAAESPQDFSASDQYVETLPTTSGPSATDDRRRGKTPLRPSAAAKLRAQGGADASKLEAIATSSDFGAPQGTSAGADKKDGNRRDSRNTTASPSASVTATTGR